MTEQTTAVQPTAGGRQGRPRPQLTIERDKLVAEKMSQYALDQEWTRAEVAEATGLEAGVVYHCLNRLTWSGCVTKVGRGTFKRTEKAYSSEYTERPAKQPKAKPAEQPQG